MFQKAKLKKEPRLKIQQHETTWSHLAEAAPGDSSQLVLAARRMAKAADTRHMNLEAAPKPVEVRNVAPLKAGSETWSWLVH